MSNPAESTEGIWKTLMYQQIVLGAMGAALGVLASILYMVYMPPSDRSLLLPMVFFGLIGLFVGLVLGVLVTLRPDQDVVGDRANDFVLEGPGALH